jgi:hypothetical protein
VHTKSTFEVQNISLTNAFKTPIPYGTQDIERKVKKASLCRNPENLSYLLGYREGLRMARIVE